MNKRVYDLEVKCDDGTWMTWETVEGLENAQIAIEAEQEEMDRGEMPKAQLRFVRRRD